tara:strand:+ start:2518 stop:3927 length:1410 start_codon:yes stop_codon:yes gene_type:complete
MFETITSSKYGNVEITDTMTLNNYNFQNNSNSKHLYNLYNSNTLNLSLNDSNNTYIIQNTQNVAYKGSIQKIEYNSKRTIITSNNHILKQGDLIELENIKKSNESIFGNNFTEDTIFRVINTTRNTFMVSSYSNTDYINGISNIVICSNTNLIDAYYYIRNSDIIKQITQVGVPNIFYCNNHGLNKDSIIKLENIKTGTDDLLNINYIDKSTRFVITDTTVNTFRVLKIGDTENIIVTKDSLVTNGYLYVQERNKQKTMNINLPNNTTNNYGAYYEFMFNDNVTNIKISKQNNDILVGKVYIYSDELAGNELLESGSNSSIFEIKNNNLLYSNIKITNISLNTWFIEAYIKNNSHIYKLENINNKAYIDDAEMTILNFYIGYIYIFDISSTTLNQKLFTITDKLYNHHYKSLTFFGQPGQPNAKIVIYIDNSYIINDLFYLKYKFKAGEDVKFTIEPLFTVNAQHKIFN